MKRESIKRSVGILLFIVIIIFIFTNIKGIQNVGSAIKLDKVHVFQKKESEPVIVNEKLSVRINYYNEDYTRRLAYVNISNIDSVPGEVVVYLYCEDSDFFVDKKRILEPNESYVFGFSYGDVGCQPRLSYRVQNVTKEK